jgi:hypothetical protein
MYKKKADPLPADARVDALMARVNELEGHLVQLSGVVKTLQKQTKVQDVLAPHISTLSVMISKFGETFKEMDAAKRELLSAIDAAQILMRDR